MPAKQSTMYITANQKTPQIYERELREIPMIYEIRGLPHKFLGNGKLPKNNVNYNGSKLLKTD